MFRLIQRSQTLRFTILKDDACLIDEEKPHVCPSCRCSAHWSA